MVYPGARGRLTGAPPLPYPPGVGRVERMKDEHRTAVVRRLKVARGHLDAVLRMVEDDGYCPEIMKQMSAVQGSLQNASRIVLRNHLETCVSAAVAAGRGDEIIDELMDALRFDKGPSSVDIDVSRDEVLQ